jgi:putative cytochrome c-type haem-binding periplasmic protein
VPNDALGGNQKELYAKAKKIYEETCSACHRLHEPNSFTAAQWPANLSGMVDAKFVALDETDLNLVLKYLQHNAKKVK